MKKTGFIYFILFSLLLLNSLHSIRLINLNKKIDKFVNTKLVHLEEDDLPDFCNKSPEEGLLEALDYYNVQHPNIVYAQACLETGNFTSELCIKHNNLFGLYNFKEESYYKYEHWTHSVVAYLNYIQYRYIPSDEDYYRFLLDIGYAEDPEYINKLKIIVKENEKK